MLLGAFLRDKVTTDHRLRHISQPFRTAAKMMEFCWPLTSSEDTKEVEEVPHDCVIPSETRELAEP